MFRNTNNHEGQFKYIEAPIVEHCNLSCAHCSHFGNIAKEAYYDLDQFEKDIIELHRITKGNIYQIRLIGGEPLLHKNIVKYLDVVHKYFKDTMSSIFTNGLLLDKMDEEFYETILKYNTFIKVSNYGTYEDRKNLIEVAERRNITHFRVVERKYFINYNMTLEKKDGGNYNYTNCFVGGNCPTLYNGKIYVCPTIAKMHVFNNFFDKDLKLTDKDVIPLVDLENIDQLFDFFQEDRDDSFCAHCNVEEAKKKHYERFNT